MHSSFDSFARRSHVVRIIVTNYCACCSRRRSLVHAQSFDSSSAVRRLARSRRSSSSRPRVVLARSHDVRITIARVALARIMRAHSLERLVSSPLVRAVHPRVVLVRSLARSHNYLLRVINVLLSSLDHARPRAFIRKTRLITRSCCS